MNTELRHGRERLLMDCAKAAFAAKGYHSTSVSHIVERAGISRATFYQYFDNKPHIFQSILDSFLQDLRGCVQRIDIGLNARPPLVQIQDNLTRVLDLVQRETALTQILLNHVTNSNRQIEQRVVDFYDQIAALIENSLELGIAMRLVRPCDTRLTTYLIIGAVKEVVRYLASDEGPRPPVEDLVQEFLQFGLGGILAGPQELLSEAPDPLRKTEVAAGRP